MRSNGPSRSSSSAYRSGSPTSASTPLELEPVDSVDDRRAGSLVGEPESGAGTAASRDTSSTRSATSSSGSASSVRTSSCSTPTSRRTAAFAHSSSRIRTASSSAASPSRTWSRRPPGSHGTACFPSSNSFASFLAARANEQIYNQASEGSKVVYALHYAGLIPAGPGKSHQSVRDISLLAALPGTTIVQPG